ncbi:Hypothetical predicted protein [Olea europaea subsp. europaea]|uniref:Uncharacterized protein n=1 Tax=Olea europaea subsp. europaea TaxID=158383 RepID=A0A8S0Q669_OLEEU|nr:Hypothetical predicted protein [Olea europaea subsp. europaea]
MGTIVCTRQTSTAPVRRSALGRLHQGSICHLDVLDRARHFEDSGHEDLHDIHSLSEKSSESSDESERTDKAASTMDGSRPRIGDKRTSGRKNKNEKRAKKFATICSIGCLY